MPARFPPFLFVTHSLFFSDIPGSQPIFHSDSLFNMLEKAPYKDLSDFSVILSYYAYANQIYPSCNQPPSQPPEAPHTQKARLQSQAKMADGGAHVTEFYVNSP